MRKRGLQTLINVENKEFSTFSTGFSTAGFRGQLLTKMHPMVNIKPALYFRETPNFLPLLHNAKPKLFTEKILLDMGFLSLSAPEKHHILGLGAGEVCINCGKEKDRKKSKKRY